jgi:hypothetical protein
VSVLRLGRLGRIMVALASTSVPQTASKNQSRLLLSQTVNASVY